MRANLTIKNQWQTRYELILQSVSEGICVINKENRISFVNPSALKLLGYQSEELNGQRYEIIFGKLPDDDDATLYPIQFALHEGQTTHVHDEFFYQRQGTKILVEYICVPLVENQEIVEAVITFQDVSERRDLEAAVDLARKNAFESAEEKANFLANMSHEIRTPLNGIIGITDLLAVTPLSSNQAKYLETLQQSAKLLLEIVNDILDFSKIEAGKLSLETLDFDLRQVLGQTHQLFVTEAVKKGIQLKFEFEKDLVTALRGDVGRLHQILNNLISNAIKFTAAGEIIIRIKQQAEYLLFEVSDTGIGIEKNKQGSIFEPFMQGDASTTRNFGGTGLGLAISKQLVELMDGQIGVASETGEGATFWFTAKFEQQEAITGSLRVNFLKINDHDFPKILVVEDNQINQQVAVGSLQQIGINADVVADGVEALKIVREKKYDLILMDCRMPRMDGFEATRQIRDMNNEAQHIKIIAMTASLTSDERAKCTAVGMDDYLIKPISFETLAEVLKKHLHFSVPLKQNQTERDNELHPLAEILDAKTLANFLEIESRGEKNFAQEMLIVYLSHTESQLAELQLAFLERNPEIIKNKAHSLKGSSVNIGIIKLFQAFEQLEAEVENDDWLKIENQIAKILQAFKKVKDKVSNLTGFGEINES